MKAYPLTPAVANKIKMFLLKATLVMIAIAWAYWIGGRA